jgi:hypothetical protein
MDNDERDLQQRMIALRNAGLNPDTFPTLSWTELKALCETLPMLDGVVRCMALLLPLAQARHPEIPPPSHAMSFNARVFLSAFMMKYGMANALESGTEAVDVVKAAADAIVTTMCRIHDCLVAGTPLPQELTAAFLVDLSGFHRAFAAWKRADEPLVVNSVKAKLEQLVMVLGMLDPVADANVVFQINEIIANTKTSVENAFGQAALNQVNTHLAANNDRLLAEGRARRADGAPNPAI